MRKLLAICVALTSSGMLFNPSLAYSQDDLVSFDDVVLLVQSDISDQTILTFLKYRNLDFALDTDAVRRLREGGVSEEINRFLLEQDAKLVVATPNYVVATGYNTGYPSYYYGARLVGATAYPLSWYNHHYDPHGFSTVYRPGAHYGPSSNAGYDVGLSLGHDRDPVHTPGTLGGNHQIGHSSLGLGHIGGYSLSHSLGHGAVHGSTH